MKIGQLAKLSGCSVQAIRYYEKQGLVQPSQRNEGNFRVYDVAAQDQLMFIRRCRSLDISLAEIGQLIALKQVSGARCDDANQIIDHHLQQVAQRMTELKQLQQQLAALRGQCSSNRTVEQCGILQKLSSPPASHSSAVDRPIHPR
ncbi:MAG: Cd(II)/Pb(II)-responsive transcriptional regulator [Immundisolibacteraceae bacterium]|nr:Cd(II)/Pb(II)-responsive transcriptional regulator [Immundisolibacteraceae bacterium]